LAFSYLGELPVLHLCDRGGRRRFLVSVGLDLLLWPTDNDIAVKQGIASVESGAQKP
jgi:hypothetical protein